MSGLVIQKSLTLALDFAWESPPTTAWNRSPSSSQLLNSPSSSQFNLLEGHSAMSLIQSLLALVHTEFGPSLGVWGHFDDVGKIKAAMCWMLGQTRSIPGRFSAGSCCFANLAPRVGPRDPIQENLTQGTLRSMQELARAPAQATSRRFK